MRTEGWDYSCGRVRKPHRRACAIVIALVLVSIVGVIGGCGGAPARKPLQDPFFDDEGSTDMVSGDFDKDEAAWRKQMAHETRHPDHTDALLKDDPPKSPEHYGNVAATDTPPSDASVKADEGDPYARIDDDVDADPDAKKPATFWEKVGRATFAAMTVLLTLGMMAAPYLMAV